MRSSSNKQIGLKYFFQTGFVVFLLTVLTVLKPGPANADAAANFVTSTGNRVLAIVSNSSLSMSQKASRFSAILGSRADMRRIGLFALGPYARKISSTQRAQYSRLLRRFVISVYFKRLVDFGKAGGTVKVTKTQVRRKDVIVSSRVNFKNGRSLPVKWRLTRSGGYKMFDLNISGVWLTLEQRSIFVSIIRRNKGDIGALIGHLRRSLGG